VGDAETCLICETLVQYVEAMIENNATVVQVEAVVKKVCNFLPDTMKVQVTTARRFNKMVLSVVNMLRLCNCFFFWVVSQSASSCLDFN
jgi:hypothetical protein